MIDPARTTIVLGPPGTGKTTTLLNILQDTLSSGINPEEVAFLAFTRKAAEEAKSRAISSGLATEDRLPYFRTIHSFAYRQLGMNSKAVMRAEHLKELGATLGLETSGIRQDDDGTMYGMKYGDRLFFVENMARIRMMPLRTLWEEMFKENIDWWELERVGRALPAFKQTRGLFDFTDMLHYYLERGQVPPLRVLFVDEAQDLSPLQWKLIDFLAGGRHIERIYVAGDDDQAIYRWAGADVNRFIGLQGSERHLEVSYRVPSAVHNLAVGILGKIHVRRAKSWRPARVGGDVVFTGRLEETSLSTGSWLLLARNGYLLRQLEEACFRAGIYYSSVNGSPIAPGAVDAILSWERLRKGQPQTVGQVTRIYDQMTVARGLLPYGAKAALDRRPQDELVTLEQLGIKSSPIWHEALDRLSFRSREFMIAALRGGEKLTATPRVKINTIHGVKGGEADNVLILSDMADRTFMEMRENPDDEARVWYVGVTRTKNNVYVVNPKTDRFYPLDELVS